MKMNLPDQTEIDGVQIQKLAPGEAYGARDLQRWGHRRATGRSGSFDLRDLKRQKKRAKKLSKAAGHRVKPF
jgi:hypothetical protein